VNHESSETACTGLAESQAARPPTRPTRSIEKHHDTSVQARSATRADELPGATRTHQLTGDWEVWKVGRKVFMLHTAMPGEPVVILKADPADAESLREAHAQITAGYHMNKKHWITLHPGDGMAFGLIDDLVTESYLLVVEGLPKQQRPVDPATFRGAHPRHPSVCLAAPESIPFRRNDH
jgi:predicted DNA-binding protein (MmcQ/YjbR family)